MEKLTEAEELELFELLKQDDLQRTANEIEKLKDSDNGLPANWHN